MPTSCAAEGAAGAYQVDEMNTHGDKSDDICKVVGRSSEATWALLDSADLSKGVVYTMTGGSTCSHDAEGNPNPVDRSVSLEFQCADRASAAASTAYEEAHCQCL